MEADKSSSSSMENAQEPPECGDDDMEREEGAKVSEEHSEDSKPENESEKPIPEAFKMPALIIGPRRGKPGAVRSVSNAKLLASPKSVPNNSSEESSTTEKEEPEKLMPAPELKQLPLPYKEPSWGGNPDAKYKIEVLKSGVILDSIDLTKKSFHVIGRLPVCDIPLAHPTISRYHAILQYRAEGDEKNGTGLYLYDLESTHGTFWNGCRIRPKTYVKLHGGHMIKFGCSQRRFILQTPVEEEEEESEYSLTELKEMRRLELLQREKEERERKEEEEELERLRKEREEAEGIDWGMGEDADEETDLTENPYALTNNEELFLDDPKKTLRGWFEREGYDMQYQTEEKGVGQFLCWVELPIDNVTGRTVRAEALVKGKKKESVIQCALEACRILDRQGLLRQATHEGRKRKLRNWEEEDYYDSDEDNFLDRTGTVERKREQRMRNAGKIEAKVETYTSLVEKHSKVVKEITTIEATLKNHQKAKDAMNDNSGEDALDAFMSNLSSALLNKADITKLKLQLQNLHKEEESLKKLIDITKPANLPSLNLSNSTQKESKSSTSTAVSSSKCQKIDTDGEAQQEVTNRGRYGLIKNKEAVAEKEDRMDDDNNPHEVKSEQSAPVVEDDDDNGQKVDEAEALKKKKRNIRRIQMRAEKAAKEMQKGYDENVYKKDYSMWLPPENQSGDGKTDLNEKFGY